MKKKKITFILPIIVALGIAILPHSDECDCGKPLAGLLGIFGCSDQQSHQNAVADEGSSLKAPPVEMASQDTSSPTSQSAASNPEVTFIELGSVNCIPCRMMQPVMKAVEQKYGSRVRIVFYDVWTIEGRNDAMRYNIRVIPTQVFLDKHGKEYFRHEGFFPLPEVEKVLAMKGVR